MANPPPERSFVVSYDEDQDKLTVCSLNDVELAPLLARALKADWPLESVNHELTDDVAQRLGGDRAVDSCPLQHDLETDVEGQAGPALIPYTRPMTTTLSPIESEFATVEEAEAYDRWLRAKVQASLADPRPTIPHDQVMADMEAIIRAAEQRHASRRA